jgi:hypothetical protein
MTTITLTRYDIENLYIGLERVSSCSIPQATRYAIARTVSSLRPEIDATNTAYPRPEQDAPPEKFIAWNQSRHAHMLEKVEVQVHAPAEMPEIDFQDLVRLLPDRPMPVVHQFHQALIASLIPWVDARGEGENQKHFDRILAVEAGALIQ